MNLRFLVHSVAEAASMDAWVLAELFSFMGNYLIVILCRQTESEVSSSATLVLSILLWIRHLFSAETPTGKPQPTWEVCPEQDVRVGWNSYLIAFELFFSWSFKNFVFVARALDMRYPLNRFLCVRYIIVNYGHNIVQVIFRIAFILNLMLINISPFLPPSAPGNQHSTLWLYELEC